jgi:dTDP-4-dehydrorhamnose 3,5-epimerase
MEVVHLSLPGLLLFKPRVFHDERGFFYESFSQPLFDRLGLPPFVQDNVSFSKKGVIRALHYQAGPGQAKLISCPQGEIFDVAIDIRPESPTFGKWETVRLNDQEHAILFIPGCYAHGYCVLSETALVHYKVSTLYNPATERSIRWNEFEIPWPIENPLLSARDQSAPRRNEVV